MFLFDTNVCIQILKRKSNSVIQRLQSHAPSEIQISVITKAELYYGARHSNRVAENLALLQRFCEPFVSLPFDDPCADYYGAIRADLTARGQLIGPYDLMIAATARARDLVLVTHNTGEFSRIAGLRIEDWEIPER